MGAVQVVTTILKFAALAFMSTVGLFYIQRANYTPWNVSGESAIAAIGGGMAIALFSYLGVETAAVAAAKVKDPDRNIPRSTIFGTLATAVVYMLSLTAVFGILSNTQLARRPRRSPTPSTSCSAARGPATSWRSLVIISGLRCAERLDDDLRRDAARGREGRAVPRAVQADLAGGVPAFGIIASTVLASIAMAINYLGSNGATVFTTLVLMTGITAAIPYAFSALAQIKWRLVDHRKLRDAAVRARHDRRRALARLLHPVHLVLAQHRQQLLGLLGAVLPGRRRTAARHPGVQGATPPMTEPEPVPAYR